MQQIGDVLTGLQNQQLLDPQNLQRDAAVGRYHPYKSPPDFVMATKHGYAKRVYVSKQEDTFAEEGRENCPCCGLPVEGDLIPLCAELSKLYHLGSGYALYFKFLKYCIAMLVMMFIVTAIYNFASDSAGTGCSVVTATTLDDSLYCLQDYIAKYTIANKRNSVDALAAQQALNLVAIILVIAFFQFIRYELRKTSVVADDNTVTPSDYTVRISNVPTDVTTREIVDWMQQFGTNEKPVVVRKVCRSYDLVEFTELTRERDALQDEKDHAKVPEVIGTIEAQISVVKEKMEDLRKKKLAYSRVAYVTFERASHAAAIENRFDKTLVRHGADFVVSNLTDSPERLHGAKIKVKRAPEPSNILWENLGFSRREKVKRKHMTNLLTGVAILVSFAIILGISYAQSRLVGNGQNESYTIRVLSIIASVLISVINFVIGQVARKLAEYEKHGTFTGYFTGVARKLSVAQFLNTAMTTLVAKSIINNTVLIGVDPTTGSVIQDDTINFYGKGGLLEGIFYVFISNAFLTPIMNIFDPFFFLKKWNRRKALENSDSTQYNQKEAHALFEGMPIDMSYKYALLIKTMYLTSFYAPAIPIGIPFAIVGLSMVYWSDKYILLRRAALPFSLGDELSKTMIEYLEWMAVFFALGNIAFVYTLKNQYGEYAFDTASFVIAWIILAITVAHAFLPMGAVNKKYFPLIDDVTENETYDQARLEFATDYDIENPITREKALIEFRQAIADGARTRDQHTGKSFDDDVANLQRNQSRNSYQHSFDEENHGGHMFNFLEGYIKTSHANPAQIARENKGQAVVMEAQRQGGNYDRPSSYKKVTGAFRGNAGNMAGNMT